MAYTHAEFKRLLPHAMEEYDYSGTGDLIESSTGDRSIRIRLGPEYEQRIASLVMPVCDVTIELNGFSSDEAQKFLDRFDQTYRRGGG